MTDAKRRTGYAGRRIVIEPDGFGVFDAAQLLVRVRWADVRQAAASRQQMGTDTVLCLGFRVSDDGAAVSVSHTLGGFAELRGALPEALPGIDASGLAALADSSAAVKWKTLFGGEMPVDKWHFINYVRQSCEPYGESRSRRVLATFFGIGYIPGPAGTYASAVTAGLALVALGGGVSLASIIAAAVLVTALSVFAGHGAATDFGSKDPRPFVLDEVAGMLIASLALWLPWNRSGWSWTTALVAFFWFRIMDILKPPPARQAEALPRGWGITVDDTVAGAMALGLTIACQAIANRFLG